MRAPRPAKEPRDENALRLVQLFGGFTNGAANFVFPVVQTAYRVTGVFCRYAADAASATLLSLSLRTSTGDLLGMWPALLNAPIGATSLYGWSANGGSTQSQMPGGGPIGTFQSVAIPRDLIVTPQLRLELDFLGAPVAADVVDLLSLTTTLQLH